VVTDTEMLIAIPTEAWAQDVVRLVLAEEPEAVANHSIRSYLFARLLAAHAGSTADVDDRLLFAATVLHDIGLRRGPTGPQRFEVDGADRAAEFLRGHRFDEREIDQVWEAIALHTSPGIAERRGALATLTRKAIGIDFGLGADIVTDEQAQRIHEAYPRMSMVTSLVDAIVAQCRTVPEKGPRYSIAGELTRERATPAQTTELEQASRRSRWGG
jgi:HD domain